MACGCPADQCTCVMSGDAYTGGSGNASDPFVVENTPFAPTSPLNSIQFTPGGVKNHSPGIDVQLSAQPNNGLSYEADGLMVDPCDLISADVDNKLTCVADGLKVDACDIVTATQQAVGDLVIAGPDCTTQLMADPSDVNQVIGASGGQWGQRPIVSADAGNDLIVGSDGGVFGDFGTVVLDEIQRCDIFDVATTQNRGNIFIEGGLDCRPELLRDPTVCEILGYNAGQAGWVSIPGEKIERQAAVNYGPFDVPALGTSAGFVTSYTVTNPTSCPMVITHDHLYEESVATIAGIPSPVNTSVNYSLRADRSETGAVQAMTIMDSRGSSECSYSAVAQSSHAIYHVGMQKYVHVLNGGDTVTIHIYVSVTNFINSSSIRVITYAKQIVTSDFKR
jgi:hypothetical protein